MKMEVLQNFVFGEREVGTACIVALDKVPDLNVRLELFFHSDSSKEKKCWC